MSLLSKIELPITPALVCLLVGNLLDGIFTLILLELHEAVEANPLLAPVYRASPVAFMLVKLCLVQSSVLVAAMVPNKRLKQWAMRFGAFVYVAVVAYQTFIFVFALP